MWRKLCENKVITQRCYKVKNQTNRRHSHLLQAYECIASLNENKRITYYVIFGVNSLLLHWETS